MCLLNKPQGNNPTQVKVKKSILTILSSGIRKLLPVGKWSLSTEPHVGHCAAEPLSNISSHLHSNRASEGPLSIVSSPSSFRKSLLNRSPLGSLPMKRCTYSVPWSCTAMAYFSGLTQDCRQKGTLVSPTVCLTVTEGSR